MRTCIYLSLLVLPQTLLGQVGWPPVVYEAQKVQPPSISAFSGLGISVACSPAMMFMGSTISSSIPGYVYGYVPGTTGWDPTWTLESPSPAIEDAFGGALDLDGVRLAVGDRYAATGQISSGGAYLFVHDSGSWFLEAEVFPSDGATGNNFGRAISLDGDRVIVGAHVAILPDPGPIVGSAYVFRREGTAWIEEQKLVSSLATPWQYFGSSVGIEGDLAAVGNSTGSVHLFRRNAFTWNLEAVVPPMPLLFGISTVELEGGVLYIGYAADSEQGSEAGAVFQYELVGGSWVETDKIMATAGGPGRRFGQGLDLDNDAMIVGALYGDGVVPDTGVAHLFHREAGSWIEDAVLMGSDSQADDFAYIVAISGTTALLGAPFHDAMGESAGAVYVFHIGDADFRRGDANADGNVDIADAISTLTALFIPGADASTCSDAADANDDGELNIADPIATLFSLFGGGSSLPLPAASCGADPTADGLPCLAQVSCP